jgi:hypothetical protein
MRVRRIHFRKSSRQHSSRGYREVAAARQPPAAFRFLRQPSRPKPPMLVANGPSAFYADFYKDVVEMNFHGAFR